MPGNGNRPITRQGPTNCTSPGILESYLTHFDDGARLHLPTLPRIAALRITTGVRNICRLRCSTCEPLVSKPGFQEASFVSSIPSCLQIKGSLLGSQGLGDSTAFRTTVSYVAPSAFKMMPRHQTGGFSNGHSREKTFDFSPHRFVAPEFLCVAGHAQAWMTGIAC